MDPLLIKNVKTIPGPDGSVKLDLPPINDEDLPTVSILVPTRNRPDFHELITRNWEAVDYPRDKLEMIVLDSSDVPGSQVFRDSQVRLVRYDPRVKGPLTVGAARNILAALAKHEYLVHMDDDDWYPSLSVVCRVRILLNIRDSMDIDACVGCPRALCLDLVTNQMFEAFDRARDGSPASISESTMAYSKKYWMRQRWNNASTQGECLDFIRLRHDTVFACKSEFVVVQFSHGANTVRRRIDPDTDTSLSTSAFLGGMTVYDETVFNNVRAKCILKIPEFRAACEFIKKNYNSKSLVKMHAQLPESVKTNPLMIDFYRSRMVTKTVTSGRDVVYYCGPGSYGGQGSYLSAGSKWNPTTFTGGSEEAVVNVSSELAKCGYRVTVYCNLLGPETTHGGVKYLSYYKWVPGDLQDVTIIWRYPSNCQVEINSRRVILDAHDYLKPEWLAGVVPSHVKVFAKSEFHKKSMAFPGHTSVIRNMVGPMPGPSQTPGRGAAVKRAMLCTSSPDRCLVGLLKALPLIRERVPDAEIHWAYGFSTSHCPSPKYAAWTDSVRALSLVTPGFVSLGHLGVGDVNALYGKYRLFVYPTRFPEIDCVSLTKAAMAGCTCIVAGAGAMPEKVECIGSGVETLESDSFDFSLSSGPLFEEFVAACIRELEKGPDGAAGSDLVSSYAYEPGHVTRQWISGFT